MLHYLASIPHFWLPEKRTVITCLCQQTEALLYGKYGISQFLFDIFQVEIPNYLNLETRKWF